MKGLLANTPAKLPAAGFHQGDGSASLESWYADRVAAGQRPAVRGPRTPAQIHRTKLQVNKLSRAKSNETIANIGLGAQIRRATYALPIRMDVVEHIQVIFGLIVLRHISDAFEGPRAAA